MSGCGRYLPPLADGAHRDLARVHERVVVRRDARHGGDLELRQKLRQNDPGNTR
jgi:hypothetical protein